ncbi:MAG: hypothetical protein AABZ53_01465 [Planctomycetota bacterium]
MAVWGSYESGKELAQSGVGVLWAARPAGAPGSEERFVIKTNEGLLFLGDAEQTERGSAMFLESAQAQKALSDAGVPGWARILEIGRTDAGAYYVADRYQRSVQKIVVRGIKVGAAGLRQVVTGIVDALVELRTRASRPHGNLKTTNVLIGGPDGPTVDRDPIVLTDLKPASTLSPKDAEDDIRAIGRLVYEMVMLRTPRDSVGLTVSMTSDWSRLGGSALAWIDFVNRLLDVTPGRALPDLSELKDLIPGTGSAVTSGRKLPLLAVGGVLTLAIAGGIVYFAIRPKPIQGGGGGGGLVERPPEDINDANWKSLMSFVTNVLSRRTIIKDRLMGDRAVWGEVPPRVQDILGGTGLEMPWDFLPRPENGWGDNAILSKAQYVPSGWEGPTGIAKGNTKQLEEWRAKAAILLDRAKAVDSWMKGILPADIEKEWETPAWETFGWTAQLSELARLRGVLSTPMGEMKLAKEEDLVTAVRFAQQGKQLGQATKALVGSMKALDESGDEALKQFAGAVRAHTSGVEFKDLIAKVKESHELARDIAARLADKSRWDYAEFSARFKANHAEQMSGGDKKLAMSDFSVWKVGAGSADFSLDEKATADLRARALAAKAKADAGIEELPKAQADPKRKAKLVKAKVDEDKLLKDLTDARQSVEPLAKETVFASNKARLEASLASFEKLAGRADEIPRRGDFDTFTSLEKFFTSAANTNLGPGFREVLIKQIGLQKSNPDLSVVQDTLGDGWLAGLKALEDAAGNAMPAKFGAELGPEAAMFDGILATQRKAALKAVGDGVTVLPVEQHINAAATLKPVTDYLAFKQNLAGIVKNAAESTVLMKSGDWKATDAKGKAAFDEIGRLPAIKLLAEDKALPLNALAAWKKDYDEIERLRAAIANPAGTSFDAAAKGVLDAPADVLNRVLLAWNLVLKLDAAAPSTDKARLDALDKAARDVVVKIEVRKPATASQLKAQIDKDKEAIWLGFMARVADLPDDVKRGEALIVGRDQMKAFGFDEANLSDPRLTAMPGARYNIVLSRVKDAIANLNANPAGKGKDDVAKAARLADANKVEALLAQLRKVAANEVDAVARPLLDKLDEASKASDKPAFSASESGPMSKIEGVVQGWSADPPGPDDAFVVYKWKGHELVFRKVQLEGQSEATYLCTREVSLGLLIDVADAAGVASALFAKDGSTGGLTKFLDPNSEGTDPTKVGPRVWMPKAGGGIKPAEGVPNNLDGWYPLPQNNKNFASGINFLPAGVKVSPPSPALPVQYVSPASAALIARRIGCRLPTRDEFIGALSAKDTQTTGANLRDTTWKAVYDQMQAEVDGPANKLAAKNNAPLKPCWPNVGIFVTPELSDARKTSKDTAFYADKNDATVFFLPAEAPAASAANIADLEGNVAEYVTASPEAADALALKAEQSLSPPSDGWKSAVDGNVFVIGGSALSPSKIGEVVYDNKTPYPLAGASCGRGFSDVGFRLAFSASGGSGSPIDLAKKALPLAKYAAIK